ncbi:MAG: thioesterase family protein [Alphaproteobacteria bacterium]|nr:thioesterase family protein [Alphaproteobacteria bacterium]
MNMFLRIVLVYFKSFFRARIGVFDTCISNFRVWLTDQDAFRHMTNSRYFSLTDVCVIDLMLRAGIWKELNKRRIVPAIVYEDLLLLRMLHFPERFFVQTRILGWDERYIVVGHVFTRADQSVTGEGFTIARFVTTRGRKVATAEVAQFLGLPSEAPLPPLAQGVLDRVRSGYGLSALMRPADAIS